MGKAQAATKAAARINAFTVIVGTLPTDTNLINRSVDTVLWSKTRSHSSSFLSPVVRSKAI
jgi:hypothetical protein